MGSRQVGIVFDLDNTLIRSHIDFQGMAQALVAYAMEALCKEGIPIRAGNRPIAAIVEEILALPGGSALRERIWRIIAEYEQRGMASLTPEDGALEVVRELAGRGHPMAVCTNNARAATHKALQILGLIDAFDPIVTREDVERMKPAPDGLRLIWSAWTNKGVRSLVMVGDSWMDGKAAEGAKARFVRYGDRGERTKPDEDVREWRRIRDLRDLLELPYSQEL